MRAFLRKRARGAGRVNLDRSAGTPGVGVALIGLVGCAVIALILTGQLLASQPDQPSSTAPPGSDRAEPRTPSLPAGPVRPAGRWKLVFDDEFDGDALDLTRWRPNRSGGANADKPFNVNSEAAAFSPQNVAVSDGALRLSVRDQPTEVGGRWYPLTSGTVSSHGTFALRDGDYVEARAKVPQGDGLWPAFWAVTEKSWPPEIDGFEFFDTARQSRPRANYHYRGGAQTGPNVYGKKGTDYRNSWHTYGWLRTAGVLTPYVDGIPYPEAGAFGVDDQEYFIILNLSVFEGHHPRLDGNQAQMAVDWVRAWRPPT